jgi:hypothetical protein
VLVSVPRADRLDHLLVVDRLSSGPRRGLSSRPGMPRDHNPTAERIRALLADEPATREVAMFGGLSFMVNDKMIVNVRRSGDLLVRVDPHRSPELVADHGARPAEMGAGRSMGPGWLDVPPTARPTAAGEPALAREE